VNDAWTPPDLLHCEPNCVAHTCWDKEKKVPQIVLVANQSIKRDEEMLYHYGEENWKIMFRNIMDHSRFAEEHLQKCDILCKEIGSEE
jgi:hypothetical protein